MAHSCPNPHPRPLLESPAAGLARRRVEHAAVWHGAPESQGVAAEIIALYQADEVGFAVLKAQRGHLETGGAGARARCAGAGDCVADPFVAVGDEGFLKGFGGEFGL